MESSEANEIFKHRSSLLLGLLGKRHAPKGGSFTVRRMILPQRSSEKKNPFLSILGKFKT